jgi:membrane-associated phospholipid phosphatase
MVVVGLAVPVAAQTRGQRIADVASYATLGLNITIDARQSWVAPDRGHRFLMLGVRLATTGVLTNILKTAFPRARPCAPSACGIDAPYADFPSGHTAFAFQALGHPTEDDAYLAKLGLAALTGGLRIAANKHDLLGVAGGAAIGLAVSRLR